MELEQFNQVRKPRRPWQNGQDNTGRNRFILTAPMFVRRTQKATQAVTSLPYKLHPWIESATRDERSAWVSTAERPQIFDFVKGQLRPIAKAEPSRLVRADVVWLTFRVFFVLGSRNWWTEFLPVDLVRVGSIPGYLLGIFEELPELNAPQFLKEGVVQVTAGASD